MGLIQDFRDFAFKGNLIDMAVGIVIGTASAAIVKSFIDNIISPLIAAILKVPDLSRYYVRLGMAEVDGEMVPINLKFGAFIQNMMDFLILAFAAFVAIRIMSRFMKRQEKASGPSAEVKLLTEIRDALIRQPPA